jgi:hypothetical protein
VCLRAYLFAVWIAIHAKGGGAKHAHDPLCLPRIFLCKRVDLFELLLGELVWVKPRRQLRGVLKRIVADELAPCIEPDRQLERVRSSERRHLTLVFCVGGATAAAAAATAANTCLGCTSSGKPDAPQSTTSFCRQRLKRPWLVVFRTAPSDSISVIFRFVVTSSSASQLHKRYALVTSACMLQVWTAKTVVG